jgi:chromosome segregation ATPase
MAIDRSEYQIRITSSADPAAIKAAQVQLKYLEDQTKEAGKAGKEMGEGFEIHGHTAAHGIHMIGEAAAGINPDLRGIADLARMARAPEFLIPAGAIAAWELLSKTFERIVQLQEAMVEWNRRLKESAIEAANETINAMAAERAAFDLRLKHQLDGENALQKAIANRLALFNTEIDHELKLMEINGQRFEAYIKYLVLIGKLTPQQGEGAINAHKQAMEDAKEREEERKMHAALAAKEDERSGAQTKLDHDPDKLEKAEKAKADAAQAARTHSKGIEQEKEKAKEMEEAAKTAEARWNTLKEAAKVIGDKNASWQEKAAATVATSKIMTEGYTPQQAKQEAKGYRGAADQQQGHVERMEHDQVALDNKVKEADEEVKKWQDEIAEAKKSVHELSEAIEQASEELRHKQSDYAETRAANQRATEANKYYERGPQDQESSDLFNRTGMPGQDEFGRRETGADTTRDALKKVTTEAGDQIKANKFGQADDAAVTGAINHIVAIFASHAELTDQQQSRLIELEQRLNAIHSQINTNR